MATPPRAGVVASLVLHAGVLSLAAVAVTPGTALGPLVVDLTIGGERPGAPETGVTASSSASLVKAPVRAARRGEPPPSGRPAAPVVAAAAGPAAAVPLAEAPAAERASLRDDRAGEMRSAKTSDATPSETSDHTTAEAAAIPVHAPAASAATSAAIDGVHGATGGQAGIGGATSGRTGAGSATGSERAMTASVGPGRGGRPGGTGGIGGRDEDGAPTSAGPDVPVEFGPYLAALRGRIQDGLEYPASARRRGLAGTVHLEVVILPTGAVDRVSVVRSSSHTILDEAARSAVLRLASAPLPGGVPARSLTVRLPVVFDLR